MVLYHDHQKALITGAFAGSLITIASAVALYSLVVRPKKARQTQSTVLGRTETSEIVNGVIGLIGNTPLVRLESISKTTGCDVLAKAEFLNPGGSSKDRVALNIINKAELKGLIRPHAGNTIFEGTVGSTGISIAVIARAKGYRAYIVMPDDQAREKYQLLERLSATVEKVRPVGIVDKGQFVNLAKARAIEHGNCGGFFANQFENIANFDAHYNTTGPEIYRQTGGQVDAIVMGAGTGGTIAGITRFLKPRIPLLRVFLVDPQGSGLYNKIKFNIMYSPTEAEGTRKRNQVDSVVEGIGINRLTQNFAMADPYQHHGLGIDDAFRVTDEEACKMARFLVREEGLFVGSSSAVNLVGVVKAARTLGPGKTIVTVISDSGHRHLTKFWNDDYLRNNNIPFELGESEGVYDFVR
jgi:cysteine synthase A